MYIQIELMSDTNDKCEVNTSIRVTIIELVKLTQLTILCNE